MSWYDALAFCDWLTAELKQSKETPSRLKEKLDQGWKISLPSEAQWEKAARGPDGWTFPGGETFGENSGNYSDTGIGTTSPVGCFPSGASPYGVLDMSGNVWEWTRSLYKDYPYKHGDGREDIKTGGSMVLRGGAFDSSSRGMRCAFRGGGGPDALNNGFGFRIVLSSVFQL